MDRSFSACLIDRERAWHLYTVSRIHRQITESIQLALKSARSRYTYISRDSEFTGALFMVTVATPVAVSKLVVTKSSGDDDTDVKRIREHF
jgi:hypothetical protein